MSYNSFVFAMILQQFPPFSDVLLHQLYTFQLIGYGLLYNATAALSD